MLLDPTRLRILSPLVEICPLSLSVLATERPTEILVIPLIDTLLLDTPSLLPDFLLEVSRHLGLREIMRPILLRPTGAGKTRALTTVIKTL